MERCRDYPWNAAGEPSRRRVVLALSAALALVLIEPSGVVAEGLSPDEQRIAAYADANHDEAVALLERLVNIPSATQNLVGVRKVGDVLAAEFGRLGFLTRWEEMPPALKRAGHLIAEHRGAAGKRLLLIGHLDTVLEGLRFERDNQGKGPRGRGNGACDMKVGDVVLLFALKALKSTGALAERRISVILTGDEEDAGMPVSVSRDSMRALARHSDLALAFETAIDDTATVARRGVEAWTLQIKGRTGHSSGILKKNVGGGAVYEAARILDGFRQGFVAEHGLTINPSLIVGGTEVDHDHGAFRGSATGKTNVIAGSAVVEGDLRFLSNAQRTAAEAMMRAVVARNLPKTSAEITFMEEYPAMAPTPGNYAALAVLDRASRDLGMGSVKAYDPVSRGAGDIAFVADLVDGLDGLGVYGERSHSPEEWVDLNTLSSQVKRAALLMYRLTRDGPGDP
jgi:glutamate carboxypeptidase